jgi:hypothetical protein
MNTPTKPNIQKIAFTPELEHQLASFLVLKDDRWLTLDRSRQALGPAFGYDERQANSVLYHLRDQNILLLAELSSGQSRWFYVEPVVNALLALGNMTSQDEQNRQTAAAI